MDFAYSSLRDQPLHSGTATAAFFFYGQVAMQRTTLSLFRSILYQLLEQIPSLRTEFLSRFKSHQEIRSSLSSRETWYANELQEFFSTAVVQTSKSTTITMFIDALDECEPDDAAALVEFLENLTNLSTSQGGKLSVCVSCRHYPVILLNNALEICVEKEN